MRITDNIFIFEHDGENFSEEHFASLCRFGYSNKRALHTIGFRGIGFKSTFSLGDSVELITPTLSVAFDRKRFTEPRWLDAGATSGGKTQIRVAIRDEHRRKEVEKNFEEWLRSPVSLLFFRNIRTLRIQDEEVSWQCLGPGPVAASEWMALSGSNEDRHLLLRSSAEKFPADALTEIREERMLAMDEQTDFPPCQIEIVLGIKGRLFVVLPTGVETALPFACNAPFIQDPARLKIKDPETSPTNRWLLDRAGRLAANGMLEWLRRTDLAPAERAQAYAIFPDVDRDDSSLQGVCGAMVEKAVHHDEGAAVAACQHVPGRLEGIHERLRAVGLPVAGGDGGAALLYRDAGIFSHVDFGFGGLLRLIEPGGAAILLKAGRQERPERGREFLRASSQLLPVVRKLDRPHARDVDARPDGVAMKAAGLGVKQDHAGLPREAESLLHQRNRPHELLAR